MRRRDLLVTTACFAATAISASAMSAKAGVIAGRLPRRPEGGGFPEPVRPGPWLYFNSAEAAAVEALADRIIPSDPDTPGGKDTGCAVFVDRQLAGPYGRQEGLYTRPPFMKGAKQQGPQNESGPAAQYRKALAALDAHCRAQHGGKVFAEMADADKDSVLGGLESGQVQLDGVDGKDFFELVLRDIQQGFFADPIHGGNRDMASWRMIGFPGARYDYRDWISRHNERYPLPPVSIMGRPAWTPGRS